MKRLAEIVNLRSAKDLTQSDSAGCIPNRKEPLYHTLSCTRKINNATFSEIWDSKFIETPP